MNNEAYYVPDNPTSLMVVVALTIIVWAIIICHLQLGRRRVAPSRRVF